MKSKCAIELSCFYSFFRHWGCFSGGYQNFYLDFMEWNFFRISYPWMYTSFVYPGPAKEIRRFESPINTFISLFTTYNLHKIFINICFIICLFGLMFNENEGKRKISFMKNDFYYLLMLITLMFLSCSSLMCSNGNECMGISIMTKVFAFLIYQEKYLLEWQGMMGR